MRLLPWRILPLLLAILLGGSGHPGATGRITEEVCLLTPRTGSGPDGAARAVVPIPRPTIFVVGDLEQVRIERNGRLEWERRAASGAPLHGPIAWPLEPIRAGEGLRLGLRPALAPAGRFAVIELIGAPQAVLQRNERLLRRLGDDPAAWLAAFESAWEGGDQALALALLFAFEGPSSEALDALRLEVYHRGCGESPQPL
jgi:hypothetical protein